MNKTSPLLRFIAEAALWTLANVLCMALPVFGIYVLGSTVLGFGPGRLALYMWITLMLTSTWGSWATLIWTQTPGLRVLQQITTFIPGVALMSLGSVLVYMGLGKWFVGASFVASGVGLVVLATMMAGGPFSKNTAPSMLQVLVGMTLYPIAATVAGGVVGALWYGFITNPLGPGGSKTLLTLSTLSVTVMAAALISTVVPSVFSRGCHDVSSRWGARLKL